MRKNSFNKLVLYYLSYQTLRWIRKWILIKVKIWILIIEALQIWILVFGRILIRFWKKDIASGFFLKGRLRVFSKGSDPGFFYRVGSGSRRFHPESVFLLNSCTWIMQHLQEDGAAKSMKICTRICIQIMFKLTHGSRLSSCENIATNQNLSQIFLKKLLFSCLIVPFDIFPIVNNKDCNYKKVET